MANRTGSLSTNRLVALTAAALLASACLADDDGSGMTDLGAMGTGGGGALPGSGDSAMNPGPDSPGMQSNGPATPTPMNPGVDPVDDPGPDSPVVGMGGTPVVGMGGTPVIGMGGTPVVGIGGAPVIGMAGMGTGGTPDDPFGLGGAIGIGGMGTGGLPEDPEGVAGMDPIGMAGMGAGGMGVAGMPSSGEDDINSGENTMGWIGCSMGENTAAGYRRIGGTRMWGGFGNGGAVVQQWTSNSSMAWGRFDQQADMYGKPVAVWIMICIFAQAGATIEEVQALVENARSHSAEGATIYITGQPLYDPGHVCTLAGSDGPESTDRLAQQMAEMDPSVIYPGALRLTAGEISGDTCHANTTGEDALGRQAKAFWGQPIPDRLSTKGPHLQGYSASGA